MSITISFDTSKMERKLQEFAAVTNRDTKTVMREEMGLLVKRCIELTPPPHGRGGGAAAKKQGEGAIKRDVGRVYFSLRKFADVIKSPRLKQGMLNALNRGDFDAISEIMREMKQSTKAVTTARVAFQQQFRNNRGIVTRGTKKTGVFDENSMIDVVNQLIGHVGKAKAGWMPAARAFGTKGIPAWVSRHSGEGSSELRENGNEITLTAVNSNKAIGSLNSQASIVQNALVGRLRDLTAKVQRILDRGASKVNRG